MSNLLLFFCVISLNARKVGEFGTKTYPILSSEQTHWVDHKDVVCEILLYFNSSTLRDTFQGQARPENVRPCPCNMSLRVLLFEYATASKLSLQYTWVYLVPVGSCSPLKSGASRSICVFFCCIPVTVFSQEKWRPQQERPHRWHQRGAQKQLSPCSMRGNSWSAAKNRRRKKNNDVCLTRPAICFRFGCFFPLPCGLVFCFVVFFFPSGITAVLMHVCTLQEIAVCQGGAAPSEGQ